MTTGDFEAFVRAKVSYLESELTDISNYLHGPDKSPQFGVMKRLEGAETKLSDIKETQDMFVRNHNAQLEAQKKKENSRNKVQAWALTVMGAIMAGIVVELFVLIMSLGA